jgi:hypothetical protein
MTGEFSLSDGRAVTVRCDRSTLGRLTLSVHMDGGDRARVRSVPPFDLEVLMPDTVKYVLSVTA